MRIALGSDHAGYEGDQPHYKPEVAAYLRSVGHDVVDCGTDGPASVDYPDFAKAVCEAILNGAADRGILICGTGIGMCIAANRHSGIRAAVCTTEEMVVLSRTHNDANVLCLGRRTLPLQTCLRLIGLWLETPFDGGARHLRRVEKMG